MDYLVGVLYSVTVALKGPVILGVLLAVLWSLLETGGLLREWLDRRRAAGRRAALFDAFCGDARGPGELRELLGGAWTPELVRSLLPPARPGVAGGGDLARLLLDAELAAARRLARLRVGLRVGPVLGLMGTLIPMGPALMNVSRGKLAMMSSDLVIAFGTTVAGLLAGALFYVMLMVRQVWYTRDVADLEHAAGRAGEDL